MFEFSDDEDPLDVQPQRTATDTKKRDLIAEYARSRRLRPISHSADDICSAAAGSSNSTVQGSSDESIPGLAQFLERLDHEVDPLCGEEIPSHEAHCMPDLEGHDLDGSLSQTSIDRTSDDELEVVPALEDLLAEIDAQECVSAVVDEEAFDSNREDFFALATPSSPSLTPANPPFDHEAGHASLESLDPRLFDCSGARLTGMTGVDGSGTGDGELHGRVRTLEERCARMSRPKPALAKAKALRPAHAMPKARDIAGGAPRAETWGQSSRMPATPP